MKLRFDDQDMFWLFVGAALALLVCVPQYFPLIGGVTVASAAAIAAWFKMRRDIPRSKD